MDNTIENQILILDYYLRMTPNVVDHANSFQIDGVTYNKIVLCPLIIDFGYKETNNPNIFYNKPSDKPISKQVDDLFHAIRKYYTHKLVPHPCKDNRLECIPDSTPKENKLFEIYPFLGINTQNYKLSEIEALFDKFFKDYENDTAELRAHKLFDMLDKYPASVSQAEVDFSYLFAGIKVYPPLGFDPWPTDSEELEKVKYLYEKCIEKNLPITTHCNDAGFVIHPHAALYANPGAKWSEVLAHYSSLKLNFAHMGNQKMGKTDWQKDILNLLEKYDNVYSDFSFHASDSTYYQNLEKILQSLSPRQRSKLLFGSDFMMVLSKVESYNQYINSFRNYSGIANKSELCHHNPAKFLFG